MRAIFILALLLASDIAFGDPLTWAEWVATGNTYKQVPPSALVVKGQGEDTYYVLEMNPTTGALPVEGSLSLTIPYSGPTGDPVPAEGAYVAGRDPSGDLQGLRVDADGNLLTKGASYDYADSVRNVYSGTPVTTGAWVQLIASTAAEIRALTIFDSSGQTLELGTGGSGSETRLLIIPPGGLDGFIPVGIPVGTRVSVRALSATASVGELTITGFN